MFTSTFLPLWLATGLYLWQAVNLVTQGDYSMAGVFTGYSMANVFLIAASARNLGL